jgi:hypothetical protein
MTVKTAGKQRGKPFKGGQSGNPAGRPKGARTRATAFGEAILQKDADDIVRAVVDAAKAGDPTAMRLCVERLIPVRKGRPITFALPSIESAVDIGKALGAIAKSMAAGELTPEEAAAVAGVIELKRRAIETVEIDARLRILEAKNP